MSKFNIGMQVTSRSVFEEMQDNSQFSKDVSKAFTQYINGNWGIVCKEDAEMNEAAIKYGGRIFAKYNTCIGAIYIITEADRSVTTILFPDEY